MRALIFVYIIEKVAQAHTQKALVSTWARSHAEAIEQDLLVAYMVIDYESATACSLPKIPWTRLFTRRSAIIQLLSVCF